MAWSISLFLCFLTLSLGPCFSHSPGHHPVEPVSVSSSLSTESPGDHECDPAHHGHTGHHSAINHCLALRGQADNAWTAVSLSPMPLSVAGGRPSVHTPGFDAPGRFPCRSGRDVLIELGIART